MKTLTTIALLISSIGFTHAQNVGIGTTTPTYPLTVIAQSAKGIVQKDGNVEVGFYTSPNGAYLQTWSDHNLQFATKNGPVQMTLQTNGDFGIGISQPTNRLHVVGSASAANNATIYAINNGSAGNGIYGISNAQNTNGVQGLSTNGTGIYGYSNSFRGVAGSTIGGTALYGNSTTGYGLEVYGKVKIAGGNTNPSAGAVLTSVDASGNAVWDNTPKVAFKVFSISSGHQNLPENSARRVQFGSESFDLSNNYALLASGATATANSSVFTAPVGGIYHFNVGCRISQQNSFLNDIEFATLSLIRNRNGVETTLVFTGAKRTFTIVGGSEVSDNASFDISVTESLQAGDRIYVNIIQSSGTDVYINFSENTWFSGFLIRKL